MLESTLMDSGGQWRQYSRQWCPIVTGYSRDSESGRQELDVGGNRLKFGGQEWTMNIEHWRTAVDSSRRKWFMDDKGGHYYK